jgi:HEAT repeat protein
MVTKEFTVEDRLMDLAGHENPLVVISLLSDSDPNVVIAAAEALGNAGNETAVPHLIRLYEAEVYARAIVAEALGKIKGDAATEFLSKSFERAIREKSDSLTLFGIIEALGAIGDEKAFALLGTQLPNLQGELRKMTLAVMVWIADKTGLPSEIPSASVSDLIDLLDDSDLRVRLLGVKALANAPEPEVTKAFVKALGASEYFDVVLFGILETRDDALEIALDKLAHPPSQQKKPLISLVRMIVRRSDGEAGMFGSLRVAEAARRRAFSLIEAQWREADEETRRTIVETLLLLDGERTLVMLDVLMKDPDPWLRMRVVEVLATQEDVRIPGFVSRYITDEDEMVRQTVEWILESKQQQSASTTV